jgi:transposase-like protein
MDSESYPVASVDYPRTFQEMDEQFRDDEACREYIRRLRWPKGFVCPHCGVGNEPWTMSDNLLRCRSCHARTSLTAGTIFEGTRKPLRTWFMAMWFVTSQKNGVSALGLQRVLGLGSYETAWTWLHKLRRAMVRPGRDALSGTVEIDETYVGGPEKDKWGREIESKAIVAIAAEERGQGIGRIRLRRVEDVSADSLLPFVRSAVVPGATIHTDGWSGYAGLKAAGYRHKVSVLAARSDPAHEVMPRVHKVASLLKRWLLGTHQGGIQRQHLDYYLDEFTFRFNRRRSNARGLLFHRLAEQAVAVEPAPYRAIIRKPAKPGDSARSGQ